MRADKVSAILGDPIVWGNLLLRAVLFALAAFAWHWHSGDSGHYLLSAEEVCRGEWGGEPVRVPLYAWFLCLTSFGTVARGAGELGGSGVALPLLGQTLLMFACGVVLYRRFGRAIAACWLFDPVLLAYGSFIMTDALFAVFVLAMALCFSRVPAMSPGAVSASTSSGAMSASTDETNRLRKKSFWLQIRLFSCDFVRLAKSPQQPTPGLLPGFLRHLPRLARRGRIFASKALFPEPANPRGLGRSRPLYFFGAALGAAILTRPVGIPLGFLAAAVLMVLALRGRFRARELAVTALIVGAMLAPRLYWNKTHHGGYFIAAQGDAWIRTVAGIVENHGSGLTFHESEEKYFREHPAYSTAEAYRTILAHLPAWAWLTAKGMARVLVGHVNVEWTYLVSGKTVLGPGWFKIREGGEGSPVSGAWLLPWLLGIGFVACYYVWLYARAARAAWLALKIDRRFAAFAAWGVLSAAFLAFAPQVFGDARFRAPVVPLVLVLWGVALERAREAEGRA